MIPVKLVALRLRHEAQVEAGPQRLGLAGIFELPLNFAGCRALRGT